MVELIDKILTRTDLENRLAFQPKVSGRFQHCPGTNSVRFDARDALGKVWNLKVSTRNQGHPKPVITGDWLSLVQEKSLRVGDRIVLTREVDGEDGVSYEIRTEHEIFKCWAPVI
ncbi:B3 domain-containing protein [Salix suchowensis]|nr:B3 domain-containing protein [Salix suchowensis]